VCRAFAPSAEGRGSNQCRINSKTEILTPVASLVSAYHLRLRERLVGPVSVESDWVGYHVYLRHGTSMCWNLKTRLESEPVTGDLTTTVVHSYNLLIDDVGLVLNVMYFLNGTLWECLRLQLHIYTIFNLFLNIWLKISWVCNLQRYIYFS